MILNKSITLIIPCKNEQGSIPKLLRRVPTYVDEVIVVDNNSSDNTSEVARKLGAIVVSEKRKDKFGIGYGYAHQKGMRFATSDYIVTMDGDRTYPLNEIKNLVKHMEKNQLDFVSCTRFPLMRSQAITKMRQFGVWILNTEVKMLYQYPMQDILSGMWAMNRKTARKLKLIEGGWDLSPEIKLEALQTKDLKFAEYHIDHAHRDNGASKQQLWTTGFNHLKYIAVRRFTRDNPAFHFYKKQVKSFRKGWEMVLETFAPNLAE